MKKHLLALAVAAAAVPAFAQNVTVYGVIDTGIQSHDSGDDSVTRSVDGAIATSRFGFKGSEDLGGGLKAIFTLEARLNPSNGSTNTSNLFNRGALVGLSGGFGTIEIGQGDTTTTQDIDSKVSQAGNLALRPQITAAGGTLASGELGLDVANVIRYTSPTMSGFSFQAGHATNNSTAVVDGKATISDIYLAYEQGPLGIYAGYTTQDGATSVAEKDFMTVGAKYDLGFMSLGYSYSQGDASATTEEKTKTHIASAAVPLGNGFTAHAVLGSAKLDKTTNGDGSGYTLAVTKAMSKRTTLYGAYTSVNSDAGASFSMTGVTANTTTAGKDPSAITLGVSHSF